MEKDSENAKKEVGKTDRIYKKKRSHFVFPFFVTPTFAVPNTCSKVIIEYDISNIDFFTLSVVPTLVFFLFYPKQQKRQK